MNHAINIIDLTKEFDGTWISKGINLAIPAGKMTAIIGRSGEGKSVLLKQLIGLIKPTSGEIIVNNTDISQLSESALSEHYKRFGYVFQFAALLDSLTIFENIGITLLEQGVPRAQVLEVVKEKLALVHLKEDILHKYPAHLSGGMRKRVGLARTLVSNPEVILYDEPTTGLDPITTKVIHTLMADMQRQLNITSIVISHDIDIFTVADYVALLHNGKIEYFGDAKTIWETTNPYIYQFIRGLPDGPIQTELVTQIASED